MSTSKAARDLPPERVRQGATCKALREKSKLKLGEAATALGISYAYLSNIEAGRKPLTPTLRAKAADLYVVPEVAIVRPDLLGEQVPA